MHLLCRVRLRFRYRLPAFLLHFGRDLEELLLGRHLMRDAIRRYQRSSDSHQTAIRRHQAPSSTGHLVPLSLARDLHVREQRGSIDLDDVLHRGGDVDALKQHVHPLLEVVHVHTRLGDQVEAHVAVAPHLVLLEHVGDEEEKPTVVLNPPHIDVARLRLVVRREVRNASRGNQKRQSIRNEGHSPAARGSWGSL